MKSLLVFFVLLVGCSGEPKHSKEKLYFAGLKADPNLKIITPKDMESGVKCSDYGPGCIRGFVVKILGLDTIFLEFDTQSSAMVEARRINQYYTRNWVIDDVKSEPILERFVEKVYEAKNHQEKMNPKPMPKKK